MKKNNSTAPIVIAVFSLIILVLVMFGMMLTSSTNQEKNALAASAYDNPERIQELMLLKSYGVPSDIIMMIVTYLSEDEEEAQTMSFIPPALEFLLLREDVQEKNHTCDRYDKDGTLVNEEETCECDYETVETNTYKYRKEIEKYLGEFTSGLSAENLLSAAQAAADKLCEETAVDDIRHVSIVAIAFVDYEEAIKRCGIDDEKAIEGFLELHKAGYFTEWLEGIATSLGVHPGESAVIGGSTHSAIRQAIQRPDLVNMPFFGGTTILPVQKGSYNITSEFGPRDYAPDPYHTGLDFAAAKGVPIYSVMDGIILMRVTNMNSFGHHVVVYHGGGITTMYAHMSAFGSYHPGDTVKRGDVIGYVGTTGLSTGNHLHFEYHIDGYASNPRNYLPTP